MNRRCGKHDVIDTSLGQYEVVEDGAVMSLVVGEVWLLKEREGLSLRVYIDTVGRIPFIMPWPLGIKDSAPVLAL